ncbi:trypsin, alkaline C-like [Bicyclus anynana]|uniref:Trypsin, alkaline C-like n=1 Tax=Bicyclus anynana TaxID=110368 RepID=A0ABM3LJX7_BICAN|nr:trypsin, alkaline C-like [Bicyclus anynana]
MANMNLNFGGVWRAGCGGTLITTTAVVGSASCVGAPDIHLWRTRLGSNSATSGGVTINTARMTPHPNYHWQLRDGNILVLKLVSPAPISNNIRPARIAGANYALPDNLHVYVAGWGLYGGSGLSQQLRHADTRVVNHDLCTRRHAELRARPGFGHFPPVWPGDLCTGLLDVGGRGSCEFDYGGPVVHQRDILVGVIGWNYACGHPYYPTVNTRVPHYSNWIVSVS